MVFLNLTLTHGVEKVLALHVILVSCQLLSEIADKGALTRAADVFDFLSLRYPCLSSLPAVYLLIPLSSRQRCG